MIKKLNKNTTNFNSKNQDLTVFETVKKVFLYLSQKERILGLFLAIGNIFCSVLETIALVSVMPIVNLIISGGVQNLHPKILIIHNFLENPEFYDFVFFLTCFSILLLFCSVVFAIFMQWIVQLYRIKCQNRLAEILCYSVMNASYEWHLSKSSSKNAHYLFNDITTWSSGGINSVLSFFSNLSLLISVCFVIIYSMGLEGFLGMALMGSVALLIIKCIKPLIQKKSEEQREFHANSYSTISEILFAIKDIKLSNKMLYFTYQYIEQFSRYGKAMGLLKILQSLPSLTFLFIGQCTILLVAIIMLQSGISAVDVSTKIALIILLVGRGIPAVNKVLIDYVSLSNAMPSLKSLISLTNDIEVINPRYLIEDSSKNLNWKILRFENVHFKYKNQTKNILNNISLDIKKGKTYCIVGKTGSGKTTFLDLFLGLLKPIQGNIFLDNKILSKTATNRWKKQIAYVPQNTVILNKDAYQNIALGSHDKEINTKIIINLLKTLDLYEELIEKNNNLNLGEFGKKISGGQRQRLSLARALYKNLPILVLDEITSALDEETENKIINIIKKLKGKVTIICVTHKKNFLEIADEVLEINKGALINRT